MLLSLPHEEGMGGGLRLNGPQGASVPTQHSLAGVGPGTTSPAQ